MAKHKYIVMLLLALVVAGCASSTASEGQTPDSSNGNETVSTATATLEPTPTPTQTPTPTETPTPTPTPDPVLPFLGLWRCESCYRMNQFRLEMTDGVLQLTYYRLNGEAISWIGPRCENINIPFYECSVTVGAGGTLSVFNMMYHAGDPMPECATRYWTDFALIDGEISITRWESTAPCAYGGPFTQDILANHSPWAPWQKVE